MKKMFKEISKIYNQIGRFRYIINRFFNKYHITELKQFRGCWIDFDTKILFACFQELCNVVEKEQILEVTDWGQGAKEAYAKARREISDKSQLADALKDQRAYYRKMRKVAKEIRFLYGWWKKREMEWFSDDVDFNKEQEAQETDTQMLIRLVKIRSYLWT